MTDIHELIQAAKTHIANRERDLNHFSQSAALKEALKLVDQQNRWLKNIGHMSALDELRTTWEKMGPLAQYRKWIEGEDWRQSAVSSVSQLYETLQKQYSTSAHIERIYAASRRDIESLEALRKTALGAHIESLALERHATSIAHSAIEKAMEQVKAVNLNISESLHKSALMHLNELHRFEVPVIDTAATAAVMQLWGREGITRQLDRLGIDFEALLKGWADESGMEEEQILGADSNASLASAVTSQGTASWLENPRNNGLMSLLGLILAIYQIAAMYMPTLAPNNSSDSPQIAQMIAAQKALAEQVEKLSQQIIAQLEADNEALPERVVRERLVVIRERPKSGSHVVTKIFPNQVVIVLDEEGKWIRIRYYDLIQEEFYEGWALKKYFSRVSPRRALKNR